VVSLPVSPFHRENMIPILIDPFSPHRLPPACRWRRCLLPSRPWSPLPRVPCCLRWLSPPARRPLLLRLGGHRLALAQCATCAVAGRGRAEYVAAGGVFSRNGTPTFSRIAVPHSPPLHRQRPGPPLHRASRLTLIKSGADVDHMATEVSALCSSPPYFLYLFPKFCVRASSPTYPSLTSVMRRHTP
jgi:hypothetical protein